MIKSKAYLDSIENNSNIHEVTNSITGSVLSHAICHQPGDHYFWLRTPYFKIVNFVAIVVNVSADGKCCCRWNVDPGGQTFATVAFRHGIFVTGSALSHVTYMVIR